MSNFNMFIAGMLLVIAVLICTTLVSIMQYCKNINAVINDKISKIESSKTYREKFKAVSKSEERKLDGEDYSFDVSEDSE